MSFMARGKKIISRLFSQPGPEEDIGTYRSLIKDHTQGVIDLAQKIRASSKDMDFKQEVDHAIKLGSKGKLERTLKPEDLKQIERLCKIAEGKYPDHKNVKGLKEGIEGYRGYVGDEGSAAPKRNWGRKETPMERPRAGRHAA
ncbi:hypothetical protein ACFLQ2_05205 [archaeon]